MRNFFTLRGQIAMRLIALLICLALGSWEVAALVLFFPIATDQKLSLGIDVGTVAAGIGTPTSFDFEFLPQEISFITTAAPDIQVTINEDGVLYNVAAAGIAELAVIRQLGRFTNQYRITLANGQIQGKTVRITITNQTAAGFTLYENSERYGDYYYVGETLLALQSRPTKFQNFAYLSFANAGATDLFTMKWGNGLAQNMRREEFRTRLQLYQNVINTAGYNLDNINALLSDAGFQDRIKEVQILPAATQDVYLVKYQPAGQIITGQS